MTCLIMYDVARLRIWMVGDSWCLLAVPRWVFIIWVQRKCPIITLFYLRGRITYRTRTVTSYRRLLLEATLEFIRRDWTGSLVLSLS